MAPKTSARKGALPKLPQHFDENGEVVVGEENTDENDQNTAGSITVEGFNIAGRLKMALLDPVVAPTVLFEPVSDPGEVKKFCRLTVRFIAQQILKILFFGIFHHFRRRLLWRQSWEDN